MNGDFKNLLTQLATLVLSGALGGWIGVQVTLAELRINMENTSQHIHVLEDIARQHDDFRERIARLEVLCKEK
jgi:hypothetical protein